MPNKQKAKGAGYERVIVGYFRESGYGVDRTRVGWSDDRGDVHGISKESGRDMGGDGGGDNRVPFVIECKNQRRDCLPDWIKQLKEECANAGATAGAVVHKKHGVTDAKEQYATMPLYMLEHLLREAGYE